MKTTRYLIGGLTPMLTAGALLHGGWGGFLHGDTKVVTVAAVPGAAAADPSSLSVASDDLGLLDRNWGCHAYRQGRTPVAWEQRFHFIGGAGDDRIGYWMRIDKIPGPVTATGQVAGLCAVAPTNAQLGGG